jgi:hypothetical protein
VGVASGVATVPSELVSSSELLTDEASSSALEELSTALVSVF